MTMEVVVDIQTISWTVTLCVRRSFALLQFLLY